jgi:hypothetical protein
MVDKKPQHENPFDDDDFDPFGDSDDFNLDLDDDDDIFQFDDDETDAASRDHMQKTEDEPDAFHDEDIEHEYEFAQDNNITDDQALEDAGSGNPLINFLERLKNNKQLLIYTLAGGLAGILIIAMVGKMFLTTPTAAPKQTLAPTNPFNASGTQTATLAQPTTKPAMVNTPTEVQPTGLATTPTQPNATTEQATTLNDQQMPNTFTMPQPSQAANAAAQAQEADLQKRIESLEGQVSQLTSQLAGNAQQNAANQEQIASLIKALNASQAQVDKLNAAMQALITAANQAASGQTVGEQQSGGYSGGTTSQASADYYVQAIIPGRAWLKNSQGQVITVGQGDAVPGYGTVTNINPQSGSVTTSTGTTIVFGINAD